MFFIQKPILTSLYLIRQALFASLVLFAMLAFYDKFSAHPVFNAIGIASIASSIFIIFTAPHTVAGQNKAIVGGYIIGILIGAGCHYLLHHQHLIHITSFHSYATLFLGSFSLFLVLILMVVLQMPHPPAAGLALGMVIDNWEPQALLLICCIIIALVLIKQLLAFKPLIKN